MKPIDNVVARCEHCKDGIWQFRCKHKDSEYVATGDEPCTIIDWEHCPYPLQDGFRVATSQ